MRNDVLASKCAALQRFGTATVHEAQGQKGAVDGAIRPVDPAMRLVGPALTVKCRPGDNLVLHYALTKVQPGQVLVVDAEGFVEAGPWGDIMSTAARLRGCAGLVIDGSVRDSQAIIDMHRKNPSLMFHGRVHATREQEFGYEIELIDLVGRNVKSGGHVLLHGDARTIPLLDGRKPEKK